MGLFSKLFNKPQSTEKTKAELVDMFSPYFSSFGKNIIDSNVVQEAVYSTTKHASKLKLAHYKEKDGKKYKEKSRLNNLMQYEPNPIENGATFIEKAMYNYLVSNNAFIYLDFDINQSRRDGVRGRELLRNMWVLNPYNIKLHVDDDGDVNLSFLIENETRRVVTTLDNVAVIQRNVGEDEFFGSSNQAIRKVLKVIDTNYQGIENAVRSSAFIRFIVETATVLSPEKRQKKAEEFKEEYLSAEKGGGVIFSDNARKVTQVTNNPTYANFKEMELFDEKVYNYFGTNSKIVKNDFTENDWNSFYESTLSVFVNKLETELTKKIFTRQERSTGNQIFIEAHRLQKMSVQSKLNIINSSKEVGLMTINEMRELLHLPPFENEGDEREVSLNYVKGSEQSEYQNVQGDENDESDQEE